MRRRWILIIASVISLIALVMLAIAFISGPSLTVRTYYPAAAPPIDDRISISMDDGRLRIITEHDLLWANTAPAIGRQYKWVWRFFPPRLPRLDGQAIGGFDAHDLGRTEYLFAVPIWFLMVLCLIAPAWWFWNRQRERREKLKDSSTAFPVGFEQ